MAKRKKKTTSDEPYLIDLFQWRYRIAPLFGLDRLVKLAHRKRSGVLYCDNVMSSLETITFSERNKQTSVYWSSHASPAHGGVYGEPRMNVPNEASAEDLKRHYDDGTEVVFSFTPRKGRTYTMECDLYKTYDPGHRFTRCTLPTDRRIARWEMTLDVSAYLTAGYSDSGELPGCEIERVGAGDRRGQPRKLRAVEQGPGVWQWRADNVAGAIVRLAWELQRLSPAQGSVAADFEKLATELTINPRIAKDLHNFVLICCYFVGGLRSLNKIGPEMMTDASVLRRNIESIEAVIGRELVCRTRGKGLIQITPAGEAVLDWWSRFYMRWIPISLGLGVAD